MKPKKKKKTLKPGSYLILSKLSAAARELDALLEKGLDPEKESEEYIKISDEAEKELDALALKDPAEATRIFFEADTYFEEGIDPAEEIYLGERVIIEKWKLKELDTPEKRAAFVREINKPRE